MVVDARLRRRRLPPRSGNVGAGGRETVEAVILLPPAATRRRARARPREPVEDAERIGAADPRRPRGRDGRARRARRARRDCRSGSPGFPSRVAADGGGGRRRRRRAARRRGCRRGCRGCRGCRGRDSLRGATAHRGPAAREGRSDAGLVCRRARRRRRTLLDRRATERRVTWSTLLDRRSRGRSRRVRSAVDHAPLSESRDDARFRSRHGVVDFFQALVHGHQPRGDTAEPLELPR